MSRINKKCKFCCDVELSKEGSILIERKDWNNHWLEMFHLDDRRLVSYITKIEGWDPQAEIDLVLNYCPMCGRKLYTGRDDMNKDYE